MPLKTGRSKKTVSSNIKEMVGSFKKTGKIGASKPASKEKAVKQAAAIAYDNAGIAKKQEERIKKRGGKVTFRKDAKLPVGIY
jgi:predicted enzyme related to lactoylglutathione lyase